MQECPKSGRPVAVPRGIGAEVKCPNCGRTIRVTTRGRLHRHAVVPVFTEAVFDPARRDGRGEYVAAVQRGRTMALFGARTPEEANAQARAAVVGQRREVVHV